MALLLLATRKAQLVNEWIQEGMKVVNFWYEGEIFVVECIEEFDPDNPHENVWVKDANGARLFFNETELEMA